MKSGSGKGASAPVRLAFSWALLSLVAAVAHAEMHEKQVIEVSSAELAEAMGQASVKLSIERLTASLQNDGELLAAWSTTKSDVPDPLAKAIIDSALIDQLSQRQPTKAGLLLLDELAKKTIQINTPHPESATYSIPALRVAGRAAALAESWRTSDLATSLASRGAGAVQDALLGKSDRENKAALWAIEQLDSKSLNELTQWLKGKPEMHSTLAEAALKTAVATGDSELALSAMRNGEATVSRDALLLLERLDKEAFLAHFDEAAAKPLLAGIAVAGLGRSSDQRAWSKLVELLADPALGGDAALAMSQQHPSRSLDLIEQTLDQSSSVVAKRYLLMLASIGSDHARVLRDQLLSLGVVDAAEAREVARW